MVYIYVATYIYDSYIYIYIKSQNIAKIIRSSTNEKKAKKKKKLTTTTTVLGI